MRTYTLISLIASVAVFAGVSIAQLQALPIQLAVAAAAVPLVFLVQYWEGDSPRLLAGLTLAATWAAWAIAAFADEAATASLLHTATIALLTTPLRGRRRVVATAAGAVGLLVPLAIGYGIGARPSLLPDAAGALLGYATAVALFAVNGYVWGLSLQIESARRSEALLAVAQERFRIAADLHDIQGHALHVIRLKIQLGERRFATDPDAARTELREAQRLISETLESTRSLAFGQRIVNLAAEVANARALFAAAGVEWTETDERFSTTHDDLLGLVIRETTTNVLRHAQATRVRLELSDAGLRMTNDGASPSIRPLRGLETLRARLEAHGVSLRVHSEDGVFTTEARVE